MPLGLGLPAGLQGHPAGLQGHPQLKKHRLENGDFTPFENGHLSGADKSPLLANGYNAPPSHLQAMQQLYQHPLMSPGLPPLPPQAGGGGGGGAGGQAHPGLQPPLPPGAAKPPAGIPAMEAITNWENCRAAYEEIVKNLERIQQERGDGEGAEGRPRDLTSHNGSPNGHSPVLNLSKGGGGSGSRGSGAGSAVSGAASDSDPGASDKDDDEDDAVSNPEDDDEPRPTDLTDGHGPRLGSSPMAASPPPYGATASMGAAAVGSAATESPSDEEGGGGSSGASGGGGGALGTMALLRNIQRLLKVAAENARAQERQVHMDRGESRRRRWRETERGS
ncbi:hypothetical protein ONE63_004783 [Megalurothrips usitatus]|uniref:Dachshund homolog 1-like n=1 Tax=Megalurothrips usitatus TaxID=439358 RepID=A0AAV7X3Y7_9NEOP|nr:hypothetical protein ONE63_004783 [Megalurothrips usitatus]